MALTNAQYDRVMRVYDEKRTQRSREADERLEEVCRVIPEYRPLLDDIAACYTAIARDSLRNPGSPDPALQSRLEACLERRTALLTENHFPADYTDVKPDCPKCGDTGYVNGVKCDCFDRIALSLFYSDHFLNRIPREHDFKHFNSSLYSDTIKPEGGGTSPRAMAEEALRAARLCVSKLAAERDTSVPADDSPVSVSRDTAETPLSLLIYGQAGVGKTFLSEAILNESAAGGCPGLYFSSQEFFDLLADAAFGRSEEAESYAALILRGDLLVIDDLGTELTNSYVESELFRVLNERIRGGRATVISTNLTPGELASRYSERIFSRMMSGFRLVKLTGDDIRLMKLVQQPR